MRSKHAACAAALVPAAIVLACSGSHSATTVVDAAGATGTERAGTLSVSMLRVSGWHDERFHYLPDLSVTAASPGRAVAVQRVDFTVDDAGSRHLLRGVQYAAPPRVQPGHTIDLVPAGDSTDRAEITSSSALTSISATVFFTDDQGQTGLVSIATGVPAVSERVPVARLVIQRFTVVRRTADGAFAYRPELTLAETSGRSQVSIKKIAFELLDVGVAVVGPALAIWNAAEVPRGSSVTLASGYEGRPGSFDIRSRADASRASVTISYVDNGGRGGMVSAVAPVAR